MAGDMLHRARPFPRAEETSPTGVLPAGGQSPTPDHLLHDRARIAALRVFHHAHSLASAAAIARRDADWKHERDFRETMDCLEQSTRWRIALLASDGELREYFLVGRYSAVRQRAAAIFPPDQLRAVTIEPAPAPFGRESIDGRLNLTGEDNA
jgi:hypothetical protein